MATAKGEKNTNTKSTKSAKNKGAKVKESVLDNILLDVNKSGTAIQMIRIHKMKNGDRRVIERGKDCTLDLVGALAKKMSITLNKKPKKDNVGYVGYNIGDLGKLVFVGKGCDFYVRKPFDV